MDAAAEQLLLEPPDGSPPPLEAAAWQEVEALARTLAGLAAAEAGWVGPAAAKAWRAARWLAAVAYVSPQHAELVGVSVAAGHLTTAVIDDDRHALPGRVEMLVRAVDELSTELG